MLATASRGSRSSATAPLAAPALARLATGTEWRTVDSGLRAPPREELPTVATRLLGGVVREPLAAGEARHAPAFGGEEAIGGQGVAEAEEGWRANVSIKPIDNPLDGERVVALSPETANEAATDWLRRPNLFPGRALTAPTLEQRQRWQASRIVVRSQAFTRGVARGLEVGYTVEPRRWPDVVRLQIAPGRALAASGEDVVLPTPVDVRLADLPVVAEPAVFAEAGGVAPPAAPEPGGLGVLRPRAIGTLRLGELIAVRPDIVPPLGVLVLQPIVADRSDFDPTDPCDRCQCAESTRGGAGQLRRLAHRRRRPAALVCVARRVARAAARYRPAAECAGARHLRCRGRARPWRVLPWERWGAPIAFIGVNAQWQPVFADRAAVVRQGGRARSRTAHLIDGQLAADSRLPGLWQARIEQLAEQLAEMGEPLPDAPALAQAFSRLPPAGLLPISAVNLDVLPLNLTSEVLQSRFFPPGFELDAAPVPIPQLDVAIREAAPLAAIDFSAAERVRLLVPVTQASYEPRLLYEEIVAAEFQQTVDRFLLVRSRALGARQGLRNGVAELTRAVTGTAPPVPAPGDDPFALEDESLAPWGPPPSGGGHRAPLAAGRHQHAFRNATATITPGEGQSLYAWVYLDAGSSAADADAPMARRRQLGAPRVLGREPDHARAATAHRRACRSTTSCRRPAAGFA